jgi:hypothetical protein
MSLEFVETVIVPVGAGRLPRYELIGVLMSMFKSVQVFDCTETARKRKRSAACIAEASREMKMSLEVE